MDSKQEKIDRICEWMGWKKNEAGALWRGAQDGDRPLSYRAKISGFDPFTNPSDCAVVMDEVVKRDFGYETRCYMVDIQGRCRARIIMQVGFFCESFGATESEAKMNALSEMIKEEGD